MVRFKNRYYLCQIEGISDQDFNQHAVLQSVRNTYQLHFGERGVGLLSHGKTAGKFILKAPRCCQNDVQTALTLLTSVGTRTIKIRILHKSGTIKKIELKAKRYFTQSLHKGVKLGIISRQEAQKITSIQKQKLNLIKF